MILLLYTICTKKSTHCTKFLQETFVCKRCIFLNSISAHIQIYKRILLYTSCDTSILWFVLFESVNETKNLLSTVSNVYGLYLSFLLFGLLSIIIPPIKMNFLNHFDWRTFVPTKHFSLSAFNAKGQKLSQQNIALKAINLSAFRKLVPTDLFSVSGYRLVLSHFIIYQLLQMIYIYNILFRYNIILNLSFP